MFFQMDLLLLLLFSVLIQFSSSQIQNPTSDNDGNDVDNDQTATIDAFGNVITPIKGNALVKKNNGNQIYHIYKKKKKHTTEDQMPMMNADSMENYLREMVGSMVELDEDSITPETLNQLIGLAGLGSNITCVSSSVKCN